ncbi:MAG: hypothetical protein IPM54_18605 [Polyangiaceae bacterium]|nr:hypothetical protein [Polyangiaceae bacterium]
MRNLQKTLALFGMMVTGSIAQLAGCANDAQDCTLNYEACSTSGSSSSSGVIPPPPECAALPSEKPEVIRDTCAYFVGGAKASDDGDGNELTPLKSLQKAVELAAADKTGRSRVYVCGSVSERIEMTAGVSVFGGFDCAGDEWQYDPNQRATIAPAAPLADAEFQASVRIRGNGTTNIEDVNIEAAAAVIDGGSSIAVIVDQATVHFARANLTAGDAKGGATGATPSDDIGPDNADDMAIKGNNGATACMGGGSGNPGGAAKSNSSCAETVGGKGGNGQDLIAANAGDPGLPMVIGFGDGGAGEDAMQCKPGDDGAYGENGADATGATGIGEISATGYIGMDGATGTKGTAGQGGGGGGGAKGKTNCNGASGGSGGAGGCGGNGGFGGRFGGSSIAIVLLEGAVPKFDSVTIATGNGGAGGPGGIGQFGAVGGNPGTGGSGNMGTKAACNGGRGGQGGNGGQGGGGLGGHSIGIAYKKGATAPDTAGADIQTGTAGNGGAGADAAGNGGNGVKDNTHELN